MCYLALSRLQATNIYINSLRNCKWKSSKSFPGLSHSSLYSTQVLSEKPAQLELGWLPSGQCKGEEAAAPCSSFWLCRAGSRSMLFALKQTKQKELDNKWEADIWHQGASFMVGFPSVLKCTGKLICHQDKSLCSSGLSGSVFS